MRAKSFRKKKINRLEIVLIASITILLTTTRYSKGKTQLLQLQDSQREKPNDYNYKIVEGKNPTTTRKDSAEISDTTLRGLRVTTSTH